MMRGVGGGGVEIKKNTPKETNKYQADETVPRDGFFLTGCPWQGGLAAKPPTHILCLVSSITLDSYALHYPVCSRVLRKSILLFEMKLASPRWESLPWAVPCSCPSLSLAVANWNKAGNWSSRELTLGKEKEIRPHFSTRSSF